jgi:hypothetical protein
MDFRPSIQSDEIDLQNYMMIGRCHIDVPGLYQSAVFGEGCIALTGVVQQ